MLGSITGCTLQDQALAVKKRVLATGFNYSEFAKQTVKTCNHCGKTDFELYSHCDRYGLAVRSMICKTCGLIFISPRMNDASYDLFYSNWYRKLVAAFNGTTEDAVGETKAWDSQAEVTMKFLAKHMPQIQINRMLDVGGSTGVFANKVKSVIGCEAFVVDPNKHEIAKALDRGLTCSCSSFMDYKTDKYFELISLLRTVEHLPDISSAFEKIRNLLTPNGMFLLDIVNHEWLIKMFVDKASCTKVDHIYQLTDKVIRQFLNKWFKGFEIASSDITSRYILYLVYNK